MCISQKFENQSTFAKIHMKNKFHDNCFFICIFTKSCLNLKFWDYVHLVQYYWCAKFQKNLKTSKCGMQDYFDKVYGRLYQR
jgi:hypothetical protein